MKLNLSFVLLVFLVGLPCLAQGVGKTGKTKPPGCAEEIEWKVVAQKNLIPPGQPGEGKTTTSWVQFKNESDFECKFVLCYMLDLKLPEKTMPRIKIGKNSRDKWECTEDGTAEAPPNFHFGCVQVSVPAHAGRGMPNDPPVKVAPFKDARGKLKSVVEMTDTYEADKLATVYMDLLKDCPVEAGCDLCKADQFLVPSAPDDFPSWVNVWVGGQYFDLDETVLVSTTVPMGNWVTMGYPDTAYPATFQGTIKGAPVGTRVEIITPPYGYASIDVVNGTGCDGDDTAFAIPWTILPAYDKYALATINVHLPETPCQAMPEGQVVRVGGIVTANTGAPYYSPGDLILSIEEVFIKDTLPPSAGLLTVAEASDCSLTVSVPASDPISQIASAVLSYAVNNGPATVVPMNVREDSISDEHPGDVVFEAEIGPFEAGAVVILAAEVMDDARHTTTSAPMTYVIADICSAVLVPTVSTSGLVLLAILLFSCSVVLMRRRRSVR